MKLSMVLLSFAVVAIVSWPRQQASGAMIGYADVILDYYDSGAGPMPGPYGGTSLGLFPVAVSLDVVLENDPGASVDFLSLPTGSFVVVGFTDETVMDGVGFDIFLQEVGASGEDADVYVSANGIDFTYLGVAQDDVSTSFDLASIAFALPVIAIKIVGLDNLGGSPGFDLVNVQVLPHSVGPPPAVPEPSSLALLGIGGIGMLCRGVRRRSTNL